MISPSSRNIAISASTTKSSLSTSYSPPLLSTSSSSSLSSSASSSSSSSSSSSTTTATMTKPTGRASPTPRSQSPSNSPVYRKRTFNCNPYRLHCKPRSISPSQRRNSGNNKNGESSTGSVPRVLAIIFVVAFALYMKAHCLDGRTPQLRATVNQSQRMSAAGQRVAAPLQPTGGVIEGTEYFAMVPPNNQRVKGLLLHFHACNRSGEDMFLLPEDRVVALAALRRQLAVVSVSAMDRETGCWSGKDARTLLHNRFIAKLLIKLRLPSNLPRMGLGTESGADFLTSTYHAFRLESMASYMSPAGLERELQRQHTAHWKIPPTIFVHNELDQDIGRQVQQHHRSLQEAGIESEVLSIPPHPITTDLCDGRLPEVGDRRCRFFLQRALELGLLDAETNAVTECYRDSIRWKRVLEDARLDDDLRHSVGAMTEPHVLGNISPASRSGHSWIWAAVEQTIEVAYARGHEHMTSEGHEQVLDFLVHHAVVDRTRRRR